MFILDFLTRTGLLLAGIAGAYSLGANNISNVVGIFVPISPFADVSFLGMFKLNGAQQLFFIGAVAIAGGTLTYGKKVMLTVGQGITEMSPVVATLISFVSLFILQNVFQQKTYIPVEYQVTAEAEQRIRAAGIRTDHLADLQKKIFPTASQFQKALSQRVILNAREMSVVMAATEIDRTMVTSQSVNRANGSTLKDEQKRALQKLWGKTFEHRWQIEKALAELSPAWRMKSGDKEQNDKITADLDYVYRLIRATE